MTENIIDHKSADQILEEIFSTLQPPVAIETKETNVTTNTNHELPPATTGTSVNAQKPETGSLVNLATPEKRKKKRKKEKDKDKKKAKKKKRDKGDDGDDDKRRHGKEKAKKEKKKKDASPLKQGTVSESKRKADSKEAKEVKHEVKPEVKSEAITHHKVVDKAKRDVKKDVDIVSKRHEREEAKKVSKTDTREAASAVKPHRSDRRKDEVETKDTKRKETHTPPRRRRSRSLSRSRNPIVRRTTSRRTKSRSPPRRSRSRSPQRRARRHQRSRSRSRSPPYRRKRSKSPLIQKRTASPAKSPRIDKAQLLQVARQNLKRMQETGSLPVGVTLPNLPAEAPSTAQHTGKTVAELTDYCKHLVAADRSTDEEDGDGKKEPESTTFTRHPFQIKQRSDTIVVNIRNAVTLPVRKPEERAVAQAHLKQQFPVSSGQQHLELEWVPVTPSPPVKESISTSASKTTKPNTATISPVPRIPQSTPEPTVNDIVAKRISSIRKLQENSFDAQLEETSLPTQSWVTHHHHTNPMTGEPMPELVNWSGAPQAWVRKDQFTTAAPLAGGVGMKLLQKMGWQPGQGLGRNMEGTLEPLSLDIKTDKKGLVSKEELAPVRPTPAVKLIQEFQGKHPVSILHELCTKRHWNPPVFEQVADIGPDHLKHFLFKVTVNGIGYQACLASTTKKDAKAQSAAACLQALGIYAPPS